MATKPLTAPRQRWPRRRRRHPDLTIRRPGTDHVPRGSAAHLDECEDEQRILGRSRLKAALIEAGMEVATPERDNGVDLIVYRWSPETGDFAARPIQMKAASSFTFGVDRKYERIPHLILAYVMNVRAEHELSDDVALVRLCGVEDIALFDLSGVLARPGAERWLDALVHTPLARDRPRRRSPRALSPERRGWPGTRSTSQYAPPSFHLGAGLVFLDPLLQPLNGLGLRREEALPLRLVDAHHEVGGDAYHRAGHDHRRPGRRRGQVAASAEHMASLG